MPHILFAFCLLSSLFDPEDESNGPSGKSINFYQYALDNNTEDGTLQFALVI
jgi:hypothetical protein